MSKSTLIRAQMALALVALALWGHVMFASNTAFVAYMSAILASLVLALELAERTGSGRLGPTGSWRLSALINTEAADIECANRQLDLLQAELSALEDQHATAVQLQSGPVRGK